MKQPSEQEKNIVGKALCDLINIFQDIDQDVKKEEKDQEKIIINGGGKIG